MHRSKILSGMLALMPAVLLASGHSSFGAAQADDCKVKPDASAPAGLHWYYRVDRANNRHCWYLHAQGLPVHAIVNATSHNGDIQNDNVDDTVSKMPAALERAPAVVGVRAETAERPTDFRSNFTRAFTSRWVDLPKSVDLNAHEVTAASNGYATEPAAANGEEHLTPAWPNLSTVSGDARPDSPAGISFGSISLTGAAVLALLLISEALVRFVRRSGRTLLQRQLRTTARPRTDDFELAIGPSRPSLDWSAPVEPMSAGQSGAGELRRVLQRASSGMKPPQSFAPSGAMQHQDQSGSERTHSALQRLKSRSFSGITWAPL